MGDILRKLNLKGTQSGKLLTVDEQGNAVSTNIAVDNVGTKEEIDSINTRVNALEGQVDEALAKARAING